MWTHAHHKHTLAKTTRWVFIPKLSVPTVSSLPLETSGRVQVGHRSGHWTCASLLPGSVTESWGPMESLMGLFQTLMPQLFFFLFIICKYTVAVLRHSRRGSQISLRMVVSHHVVAGIWTPALRKSSRVLLPTEPSHQPRCPNYYQSPVSVPLWKGALLLLHGFCMYFPQFWGTFHCLLFFL